MYSTGGMKNGQSLTPEEGVTIAKDLQHSRPQEAKILSLGDVQINYGEFCVRND